MITNNRKDLIEVLKVLEEALNQFELLKMEFLGEVHRKINRRATVMAFLPLVIILFFYLISGFAMIYNRIFQRTAIEAFIETFIITFSLGALGILFNAIFKNFLNSTNTLIGKKALVENLLPKYVKKGEKLITTIDELLDCQFLNDKKLPIKYINLKSLNYIREVLESDEVFTLQEAVNLLDLELKHTRIQHILMEDKTRCFYVEGVISRDVFEKWLKEEEMKMHI